ncbi:MAG TPA: acylphosphatase [Dongiaceae bacterium]|jgi:acylphosphatase|nr:acylphosphatase [Dongiaceae bacterium]
MIARRLRISGRVQGVGFRDWFARAARQRHVEGWVRNRIDGTVEALCVGEAEDVEALIQAAHAGPALARVTAIDVTPAEGIVAEGFRKLPTV